MQQEILHIDAVPDETYPLRILQAYRRLGDSKWSTSSHEIVEDSVIVKQMNEWQAKRNELLDQAIEILAAQLERSADQPDQGGACGCMDEWPASMIGRVCELCWTQIRPAPKIPDGG